MQIAPVSLGETTGPIPSALLVEGVGVPSTGAPAPAAGPTNAATCTGFDPAACVPDRIEQSIAAAAAAQDFRVFVHGRSARPTDRVH